MKKTLLLLIIFISINFIYSQKRKDGIELINDNAISVIEAGEIVYYGWDFTQVKLFDGDLMGEEEDKIKSNIGSIIGLLSENYPPEKIAKLLDKEIIPEMDIIQRKYFERDFSNIVSFTNFELTTEQINNIVHSYKLSQTNGIGLVLIAECMNKPDRFTTAYVTFFDIETKSILWLTKMKGYPDRKSKFSKEWFYGFEETILYWVPKFYKPKKKHTKKS